MKLLFVHDRIGSLGGAESNLRHTAAELQRRGHAVGLAHGPGTGQGEGDWLRIFSNTYDLTGNPAWIICLTVCSATYLPMPSLMRRPARITCG